MSKLNSKNCYGQGQCKTEVVNGEVVKVKLSMVKLSRSMQDGSCQSESKIVEVNAKKRNLPMTLRKYLRKYCQGQNIYENIIKVKIFTKILSRSKYLRKYCQGQNSCKGKILQFSFDIENFVILV